MLDESWGTTVPEGFDPKEHPTYPSVDLVPVDIDVEAIAASIDSPPVRRKPGRKPKVQ